LRSFKVMSTIASHSPSNISETRLGSKGIGIGLQGIKWSRDRYMTSRDPERSNSRPPITLRASKCRKRLDLETPFQRTTNRKGLLGNGQSQTATPPDPVPRWGAYSAPRDPIAGFKRALLLGGGRGERVGTPYPLPSP